MKAERLILLFSALALLFCAAGAAQDNSPGSGSPPKQQNEKVLTRAEFRIAGTDCQECLKRIKTKITSLSGVKKVVIWLWPPYHGLVEYNPQAINIQSIEKSVANEHVKFVDLKEQETHQNNPASTPSAKESAGH